MGYIVLNNVLFNPAASVDQTVRVEYRQASSTGAFTLVNNAAPVLANGNFSPILQINGLTDGETYTVKVTSLCNGAVVTQNFTAGVACRSFTLQGNTGGGTVRWTDCQSGSYLSRFINGGEQFTFCTRADEGYDIREGGATETSDNGACQN